MYNFKIVFAYAWAPWLFLLLIPAFALPLYFHFRINKRFRRTRYRIISLVLHLVIMVLSVCALTGMSFSYEVDNPQNEIILLVDVSDTQEAAKETRDDFVQTVLNESGYDGFRVGVVTFGFTQTYAVPLTYDIDQIYGKYTEANLPDTTATDIASALRYAADLFENPQSAKIVLITDGQETDERAMTAIGAITARGIRIDAVHVPSGFEDDCFQIMEVTLPEYHVNLGEEVNIDVTIRSKTAADELTVDLFDNGSFDGENGSQKVNVSAGTTTLTFRNVFTTEGLHELRVRIAAEDALQENNEFYAYLYLEVYSHVLILERYEGTSKELEALLTQEDAGYQVDTINVLTREKLPATLDALRQYDQVILNNIANEDLPEGFDELLYSYVYDYGGGLFTVGGDNSDGTAHAYNRADLNPNGKSTLLQQMLPVEAIDYTPPVGVVLIIDISGSMDMDGGNGYTKRELAKQGAISCLEALTERDYVAVMTLDSKYDVVLPMTSVLYKDAITNAIEGINGSGGTVFTNTLDRAGQLLTDCKTIDRRHIIIATDGVASDMEDAYSKARSNYINNKITLSIVGIGMSEGTDAANNMKKLVDEEHGNGRLHIVQGKPSEIGQEMYEDLNVAEIKEVIAEPFYPVVSNPLSSVLNGVNYGSETLGNRVMNVQLGGFYGVKVRSDKYLVLEGEFEVPLYAQWKFGAGSVGSFMSDLSGNWSSDFMADSDGRRFLLNVVSNLMPTSNIRSSEISANLIEENYINQMNVFASLEAGETVQGEIIDMATGDAVSLNTAPETLNENVYVTMYLGAANGYARCNFVIKKEGVYRIVLNKIDAEGNVKATYEAYKSFSFSQEYNLYSDTDPALMLSTLAERSGGTMISELDSPWEIFANFETKLVRSFDPRWLFMSIALVLVLLDITVSKFRFKWPHELIREHRQKKAQNKK